MPDPKQSLEQLKPIISLIENYIRPYTSVDRCAADAEFLHTWAMDDMEALTRMGLDPEKITSLPMRAGALRASNADWQESRLQSSEAIKIYKELSPIAYDMRDDVMHHASFAFRNMPELLEILRQIREGQGVMDLIQDIVELHSVCSKNKELLSAIHYDMEQLDKLSEIGHQLRKLYAVARDERLKKNDAKILRDQAYTYMKEAMDEIREYGRYVFHDNEERLKGYRHTKYRKAAHTPQQQPSQVD